MNDSLAMKITFLANRPLGLTFRWYVILELFSPTLFSLLGLTVLVLTKELLGFSDLVINRGFGITTVALLILYETLPLLARTLPFAVLIGSLVGLGRLKADREIIALASLGVSERRLLGPVILFACGFLVVGLILSLAAAPWATQSLQNTLRQMIRDNPGLVLRSGTVHDFNGVKLLAREVSARGDELRGVLLWIPEVGQTIFAERGALTSEGDGVSHLALSDGVMLSSPRGRGEETRFSTYWKALQDTAAPSTRLDDVTGSSLAALLVTAQETNGEVKVARRARLELHRRFAYPAAILAFAFLAVPLALTSQRGSRAAGGITGLVATVVYYGLMQLGEGLIQANLISVGAGAWLPNVVVVLVAFLLLEKQRLRFAWPGQGRRQTVISPQDARAPSPPSGKRRHLLPRYVGSEYGQMLLLSFGILLVGYLLVDILERLQWFARHQATAFEVLRFYSARLPLLASRVTPMSLLLAAALTVSQMSSHRELTAMRACGVSAIQALFPILVIAGVFTPLYLLLNEVIVPQTNAFADQLKDHEIKNRGPEASIRRMMIWYQDSAHLYQASRLDPRLGEARDLSIYELGESGLPVSRIDARSARHVGNGVWELEDPIRISISSQGIQESPAEARIQLGEAPSTTIDTMHLNALQLRSAIHDVEASGYNATTYRVDFYARLAAPFSCLLLPMVVLLFAVTGPPFPSPAQTLLVSVVIGVGYILLTGVCTSLGYRGTFPPFLAGGGPVLILVAGVGWLVRRRNG